LDMLQRIIEQNNHLDQHTALMTENSTPDDDSSTSSTDPLSALQSLTRQHPSDTTSDDGTCLDSDDISVNTNNSSSTEDFGDITPPPPGSLLEFWDKPFHINNYYDLHDIFHDDAIPKEGTSESMDSSDDDSYTGSAFDLYDNAPVLHYVSAKTQVSVSNTSGELVDSGGNFCMCNDLTMLVNIKQIVPFGINMAVVSDKTSPT
jgi:hypothetical protein